MATILYALDEARPGHAKLGKPFYVGMGTPKRPYEHLAKSRSKKGHWNLRLHEILTSHAALGIKPTITILATFPDRASAAEAERAVIELYGREGIDPDGMLCNIASGGEGPDSTLMSDPKILAKISAGLVARWADPDLSPESKANSLAGLAAARADPLVQAKKRARASAAQKASWADPDSRARRIAGLQGNKKTMTPEAIAARQANARLPRSEETRAAQKAASDRNWADPTFRAERSASQTAAWKDPEKRANMLARRAEGIAASWKDPEVRAKRIAAIKAASERRKGHLD